MHYELPDPRYEAFHKQGYDQTEVVAKATDPNVASLSLDAGDDTLFQVNFQTEVGGVGTHVEDLLALALGRLEKLDEEVESPYNKRAAGHIYDALAMLKKRTMDRVARGVEGSKEA